MTTSMTAFARQEVQTDWGVLIWEIRSVNHRYLEMHFRLPDNFRDLEPVLREQVRKNLARGKIESTLYYRNNQKDSDNLRLNTDLLNQLSRTLKEVEEHDIETQSVSALELLQWPGVLQTEEVEYEQIKLAATELYRQALEQLAEMRSQEGAALAKLITQRLNRIAKVTAEVRQAIPEILQLQKDKLLSRFEEIKIELDPSRIEQETVLLLQKYDVDEEMDRLETHVKEVKRTLKKKGAVGRRLDFLMQELNREANTLSSKAIDTEVTQAAVELKVLIEQMREQIQNLE